jgi:Domain of unknown function (DUF6429)/Plasmid pRiA4b ORF-3-like protein
MTPDKDRIDEVVLALLCLTLHDANRAWKGFDRDTLNRLYEKGFIHDPRNKTKSVVLTREGLRRSEALFEAMFVKPDTDVSSELPRAQPGKRSKQVSGTGQADIFTFRVSLKPKVYRDLEISRSKTLYEFAAAIVEAFDFDFDHSFGFYSDLGNNPFQSDLQYESFADIGERQGPGVERTRIETAFPKVGAVMKFLFDYGDEWHFRVEVIGETAPKRGVKYPHITNIVGKAPAQYEYPEDE